LPPLSLTVFIFFFIILPGDDLSLDLERADHTAVGLEVVAPVFLEVFVMGESLKDMPPVCLEIFFIILTGDDPSLDLERTGDLPPIFLGVFILSVCLGGITLSFIILLGDKLFLGLARSGDLAER